MIEKKKSLVSRRADGKRKRKIVFLSSLTGQFSGRLIDCSKKIIIINIILCIKLFFKKFYFFVRVSLVFIFTPKHLSLFLITCLFLYSSSFLFNVSPGFYVYFQLQFLFLFFTMDFQFVWLLVEFEPITNFIS